MFDNLFVTVMVILWSITGYYNPLAMCYSMGASLGIALFVTALSRIQADLILTNGLLATFIGSMIGGGIGYFIGSYLLDMNVAIV